MSCGNIVVSQASDSIVTYTFNVQNLNGNTITNVTATSTDLTLTNITNDDSSINVTVDSNGVTGKASIDFVITLSNGDVLPRCLKFSIGDICF